LLCNLTRYDFPVPCNCIKKLYMVGRLWDVMP